MCEFIKTITVKGNFRLKKFLYVKFRVEIFHTDRSCTKYFNNEVYLTARLDTCMSGLYVSCQQCRSWYAEKTDLAIVALEYATVRVLSEWSAIFMSFWRGASSSRPCSSAALALFSNVDSDGFLAVFSAAVSRHWSEG